MYAYALVKSLYDQHRDFVETLQPFILSVLEIGNLHSPRSIQTRTKGSFGLELPLHVVERALRVASSSGLAKHDRNDSGEHLYALTLNGQERASAMESERDVQRRVNSLLDDITEFVSTRGLTTGRDQVYESFRSIVNANLVYILSYVHPFLPVNQLRVRTSGELEQQVVAYITEAEKARPTHYETIKDLVYGSLVTAVLSRASDETIEEVHQEFDHTVVYLDANFAFSVLGMDPPHVSGAAQELFRLLAEFKISPRMLSFTVDEMRRVLTRYANEYDKGSLTHEADSVYVQMRVNGVRPSDALELRQHLDDVLIKNGIGIEEDSELDVRHYSPQVPELLDALVVFKGASGTLSARSDLAAIEYVAAKRGRAARSVEKAQYFFLSSDAILYRFNNDRMDHSSRGTVSEVMLDRVLTNILWLKNPSLNVSLEGIVAAHSRGLLHKETVWYRVCEVLSDLGEQKRVSLADVTCLLTSHHIDELMDEVSDLGEITPEMMISLRDRACQDSERQRADELEDAAERERAADEAVSRAEQQVVELRGRLDEERRSAELKEAELQEKHRDDLGAKKRELLKDARPEAEQTAERLVRYAQAFALLVAAFVSVVLLLVDKLNLASGVATLLGTGTLVIIGQVAQGKIADELYRRRQESIERNL